MTSAKTLTIAISGASGSIYGFTLLKFFLANDYKVDFVISCNGEYVTFKEMGLDLRDLSIADKKNKILELLALEHKESNFKLWDQKNIAASIASGSYKSQGMIIAPCSVGSIGNIASGTSNNLITRAADVVLKERKIETGSNMEDLKYFIVWRGRNCFFLDYTKNSYTDLL